LREFESFRSQNLANILWAYATLDIEHPVLFKRVGDHVASDSLKSYIPQDFSNIVRAFATAGVQHAELFETVGDHINKLDDWKSFDPQAISNTVWAYATVGVQHAALFEKVGTHIHQLDNLEEFTLQAFANTVWAYATAEMRHNALFEKVGNHVNQLDNLKAFTSQNLASIVWAFATANQLRSDLFEKVGIAVSNRGDFQSFNIQNLSNIAWAYAVANADSPMVFNDNLTLALKDREHQSIPDNLYQLYQWHLWQTKELSQAGLPEELREWCYQAFVTADTNVSRLQKDVVNELKSMDLNPVEEYQTPRGHSIDALVKVKGRSICIEVDGPSHFDNRKPTATTLLKRRQIAAIDKIPLVSVPYWKWNKLGKDCVKKQQYLRSLVGI
jgi:hypothetical protein